jgi:hypothetical protein
MSKGLVSYTNRPRTQIIACKSLSMVYSVSVPRVAATRVVVIFCLFSVRVARVPLMPSRRKTSEEIQGIMVSVETSNIGNVEKDVRPKLTILVGIW